MLQAARSENPQGRGGAERLRRGLRQAGPLRPLAPATTPRPPPSIRTRRSCGRTWPIRPACRASAIGRQPGHRPGRGRNPSRRDRRTTPPPLAPLAIGPGQARAQRTRPCSVRRRLPPSPRAGHHHRQRSGAQGRDHHRAQRRADHRSRPGHHRRLRRRPAAAETVRQQLASRGWTAPKSVVQPAKAEARTRIVFPQGGLAVAQALARTLPFPAELAACDNRCTRYFADRRPGRRRTSASPFMMSRRGRLILAALARRCAVGLPPGAAPRRSRRRRWSTRSPSANIQSALDEQRFVDAGRMIDQALIAGSTDARVIVR